MERILIENNKKKCCGCGACFNICPKNAIKLIEDENGFYYPVINENECINCGLCEKVCNFRKIKVKSQENQVLAFAAYSKDEKTMFKSSSGGIATEFSKRIILEGGVVYGCCIEKKDKFKVEHIRIDNVEELYKIQGSKYVQSDLDNIFKKIKIDLEDKRKVLFIGTPCQVDGLYGFLQGKEYENLYTIDIICHGIPSNQMFNSYIEFEEKKYGKKIKNIFFRDKTSGGNKFYNMKLIFEDDTEMLVPSYNSSFYQLFLDQKIFRENCYECPYANKNRIGDITLGDYWGIKEEHLNLENFNVDNGVSCVICSTTKGKDLLNTISDNICLIESNIESIARHNKQLNYSSNKHKSREKILELNRISYDKVEKYYRKKDALKNFLKKIRDFIK